MLDNLFSAKFYFMIFRDFILFRLFDLFVCLHFDSFFFALDCRHFLPQFSPYPLLLIRLFNLLIRLSPLVNYLSATLYFSTISFLNNADWSR
jgi:hypothetical protein